ncbi:sulfatase [Lentisphaera araneosa HTCC2155]|uniref:Sulfatase n=1 Tax=Lentisphaera araneosa HTCC2155 TaxID=313628 RepID=A6DSG7_9BACT|nr:sulfatase-like hydrolase/transferase [Lentisphaera araneosa]EDM25412.1 sulfatase [Lentisphaera araneosa HTCC2155]
MKFCLLLLSAFLTSSLWAEKPNIVVFLADDTDKSQVSLYGAKILTPNLDRLAKEGMVFNQAYVSSTVCVPSRYTFVTGRHPGRSKYPSYIEEFPENKQGSPEFNVGLELDGMNVGKVLADNGYVTGWTGKYHIGGVDFKTKLGEAKGLDPTLKESDEIMMALEEATRKHVTEKLGWSWAKHMYEGNMVRGYSEHNLEWTVEAALDFLEENKDKPFYLHVTTTLLHGPDQSWESSFKHPNITGEGRISRKLDAEMPPRETIAKRLKEAGYDHALGLTWMDDGIGAILNKLDELGIADNTIFIFVPDHGSTKKASMFSKDGSNVPMVVRYPNGIKAGTVSDSLVQNIDFVPTFFDYAGVTPPEAYEMDGVSMRPVFEDPEKQIHESLFFQLGSARGVLKDGFKYIANRFSEDRIKKIKSVSNKEGLGAKMTYTDGHIGVGTRGMRFNPEYLEYDQLYNLSDDALEKKNLSKNPEYAQKLKEMKAELLTHLKPFDRPFGEFIEGPGAVAPGQIDEEIATLKAHILAGGYVGKPKSTPKNKGKKKKK